MAYHAEEGHNWRSIIFSLLVIAVVIAGIVTAIYLLGYVDELLYWSGRRMKLDEYLQGELTPRRLPSAWISPTHFVFQSDDGGLAVLDTTNDSVSVLVTNHTLRQLNVKGYQCSSDLRYVLFKHNVKQVSICTRGSNVPKKTTIILPPGVQAVLHCALHRLRR